MHSDELRKYLDIINENSEEVLTEGMLQKLAGLALGTVLALGPQVGEAGTVFSYMPKDGVTMKMTRSQDRIPADAKVVFSIDTVTDEVTIVKGGVKNQEIKPDPAAIQQGKQGQTQVTSVQEPQTQISDKSVEKLDNKLIFSGYSIEEIKDRMIDKIHAEYPDADIEDKGRTLVSTRQGVHMKNFGAMFMTVLMKGGSGTADVITKYNFSKQGDKIQVVPFQQMRYTNAFGQPEVFDMKPSTKTLIDIWYKDFNDASK